MVYTMYVSYKDTKNGQVWYYLLSELLKNFFCCWKEVIDSTLSWMVETSVGMPSDRGEVDGGQPEESQECELLITRFTSSSISL